MLKYYTFWITVVKLKKEVLLQELSSNTLEHKTLNISLNYNNINLKDLKQQQRITICNNIFALNFSINVW